MTVSLQLGALGLAGFEVPGRVAFGGAQSLTVHKLPGGVRVVDVMGRDDADLVWSGVISGANASERARALDGMRTTGDVISLSWDQFFYDVLIAKLKLDYRSPWWIEYRIACKVVSDETLGILAPLVSLADQIRVDLAAAGAYADVSSAVAATSIGGSASAGTAAAAAAARSLATTQATISQGIDQAGLGLGSGDLAVAVAASGSLARLAYALGFVNRASRNFAEASG